MVELQCRNFISSQRWLGRKLYVSTYISIYWHVIPGELALRQCTTTTWVSEKYILYLDAQVLCLEFLPYLSPGCTTCVCRRLCRKLLRSGQATSVTCPREPIGSRRGRISRHSTAVSIGSLYYGHRHAYILPHLFFFLNGCMPAAFSKPNKYPFA